ncbi:hypothetical protein [Haloarcula argentinensis]|uniref:Uncharacterized protein n=1 Tax=Haloarcula argentinensis TaxID=43776 RepID=A0A830FW67_HALAR|nr:hypothetical protein [Haloarcula argentinensis]EMA26756.1 hypothetical protein C443_00267 [Haloarcula argentinensis DSM 12282]MDS0255851.1 hypothetical protein [Haloarcula argentinensis]GGM49832.1 hypothetical protein GCM10009006_33880 [Haloarcula argentinensis]
MTEIARIIALFVVVSTVPLGGCGDAGGKVSYSGTIEVQNEMFVLNGSVGEEYFSGPGRYEDVAIHLYDKDGEVFRTISIGDINGSEDVSIRDERIPVFVVVDSPDIWGEENSDIATSYYERKPVTDREYLAYVGNTISERDELPVSLP